MRGRLARCAPSFRGRLRQERRHRLIRQPGAWRWSCPFRRPALPAHHVVGPALAAAGEVLAVGDEAVVQPAGEQRDAAGCSVVPEPVAGEADLAAATGLQHGLIQLGPGLGTGLGGEGERDGHRDGCRRTSVLAGIGCCGRVGGWLARLRRCAEGHLSATASSHLAEHCSALLTRPGLPPRPVGTPPRRVSRRSRAGRSASPAAPASPPHPRSGSPAPGRCSETASGVGW